MKKKIVLIIAILVIVSVFAAACSDIDASLLERISQDTETTQSGETGTTQSGSEQPTPPSGQNGQPAQNGGAPGANGGTQSTTTVSIAESQTSAADYDVSALTALTEEQTAEIPANAVTIDLNTLTKDNAPENTTFKNGVLTIKAAGTYVLSGTLNGSVQVDKNVEGTVRIVLSGATIRTLDSQTTAAITFNKSDSLRILTIADGTENLLSDSVGDTAEDGDGAALQAKKCSLTINGKGTLTVQAVGEDANGIKVKDSLTVLDATITVSAVKNGVKADNLIYLKGANLTVTAGNDGVKTDIEPETDEEALAYAADKNAGVIYIENSSLTVTAGDDGIAANSLLYIANGENDRIEVTTNGGAPATVTERSSDAADGKALKAAGITLEDEEGNETDYAATFDENYAIVITGGTFSLNSNDDALHSKGNVLITGGTFTIASGDDGIHAEYLTKITGGSITIQKSYEGIEGGAVEITGGTVNVSATDDGVNAANSDLKNYSYYILISDGELTVNCQGDGVDSNGTLLISGGTVTVFGPSNGGNSAIDSENGTAVNGGTVIATCRESMDPVGGTQVRISANVSLSAGQTVTLKDASGNVIASFTSPKTASNVLISTPALQNGSTYTLTCGNSSTTVTASTSSSGGMGGGMGGNPNGGMGGMGGNPGGMGGRGARMNA